MGIARPSPNKTNAQPLLISSGVVGEKRGLFSGWLGFNGMMLLPALLIMGVFLIYPAVAALRVGLQSWTGFGPTAKFIGLENFRRLLFSNDDIFRAAVSNSVLWMLVGGAAHFFFALLLATGLQHPRMRGKKYFQTMIIFPMFISAIGTAMLWKQLYDPKLGLLNRCLAVFQLADPANARPAWLDASNGIYPILLMSVWATIGGQVILLLAGLRQIPTALYEAARIDGASEIQCFRQITLPLMRDILKIAAVLWIIESLQVFGLVQGLLGPDIEPKLHVVSTYMFDMAFNNRTNIYRMGQATAMALILVTLTLLLVGLLLTIWRMVFGKERLEF